MRIFRIKALNIRTAIEDFFVGLGELCGLTPLTERMLLGPGTNTAM